MTGQEAAPDSLPDRPLREVAAAVRVALAKAEALDGAATDRRLRGILALLWSALDMIESD